MFAYCNNNPVNNKDPNGARMDYYIFSESGEGYAFSESVVGPGSRDKDSEKLIKLDFGAGDAILSVRIRSDVGMVAFDSLVGAATATEYAAAISAVIKLAALSPTSGVASVAIGFIALDIMAGAGVMSASNIALADNVTRAYKTNDYVIIELYTPESADDFWEWLVNGGIRIR